MFIDNGKEIRKEDFKSILQSLGIKANDVLFVHSDVSVFGKPATFNRSFILSSFVEALQAAVPAGTLILPAFTYSFCKREKFSIKDSESTVGALTEYFRKKEGVLRTKHPIFSVSVWGNKSDFLNIGKDSFNEESIFGKLHKKKAKLLFCGAPFQACTYMHYIEQMHGVPYRYIKSFKGKIIDDVEYEDEYTFFARYLDANVNFDMQKTERYLFDNGFMKKKQLGSGKIILVDAEVLYQKGLKLLDKDIFYFLKTKPDIKKIEKQKCRLK